MIKPETLLKKASEHLPASNPADVRSQLAVNPQARPWKKRVVAKLQGMVWHQELGWGSVENVAKYHTGKNSHLLKGGTASIAYTFAIRRDGQILLCNDLNLSTWSQGYRGRTGDENAEFLSVLFEGMFKAEGVTDPSAGEPNAEQIQSGLALWNACKEEWKWNEDGLYGHFHFGKPSCPGDTLKSVILAVRANAKPKKKEVKLDTVKDRQKALKSLGFYKGSVDGIWGPGSKGSLVAFQSKEGLAADGIWGPRTEAAMRKRLQ